MLNKFFCIAAICVLCLPGSLAGGEADTPEKVIERAIELQGGREALMKFQSARWNVSGNYFGMGNEFAFSGTYTAAWPDLYRLEVAGVYTIVRNKETVWIHVRDNTTELEGERRKDALEQIHSTWVATLVPLKEAPFKLSHHGEVTVNDEPAIGINVDREGFRTVVLFFDKASGQLVKRSSVVRSQEQRKEVNEDVLFSSWTEVNGVKLPGKFSIYRDGQKYIEGEYSKYEVVEKPDEKNFAKP